MSKPTYAPADAMRRVLTSIHNLKQPLNADTFPILTPDMTVLERLRFPDHLHARQPPTGFVAERLWQDTGALRTKLLPLTLETGQSIILQGHEVSPWAIIAPTVAAAAGGETNKMFDKWLCPVPLKDAMVTFLDALQKTLMVLLVEDDARFATARFYPLYTVMKGERGMKVKWTVLKTTGPRSNTAVTTLLFDPHGEQLSATMREAWLSGAYGLSRTRTSTPVRVIPFFDLEGVSSYYHAPSLSTDPSEPGCLEIRVRMSLAAMMLCSIQAPVLSPFPKLQHGVRAPPLGSSSSASAATAATDVDEE